MSSVAVLIEERIKRYEEEIGNLPIDVSPEIYLPLKGALDELKFLQHAFK